MYDTARRVALVKQRVRENNRRRQRRGIYGLSAACMLLCAALMQTAGTVVGPGQTAVWGVFGAMLLREDAGGYVLVAVVSFAAAAAITLHAIYNLLIAYGGAAQYIAYALPVLLVTAGKLSAIRISRKK